MNPRWSFSLSLIFTLFQACFSYPLIFRQDKAWVISYIFLLFLIIGSGRGSCISSSRVRSLGCVRAPITLSLLGHFEVPEAMLLLAGCVCRVSVYVSLKRYLPRECSGVKTRAGGGRAVCQHTLPP